MLCLLVRAVLRAGASLSQVRTEPPPPPSDSARPGVYGTEYIASLMSLAPLGEVVILRTLGDTGL